eukprot:2979652-Karenia_brevis.AAC.1
MPFFVFSFCSRSWVGRLANPPHNLPLLWVLLQSGLHPNHMQRQENHQHAAQKPHGRVGPTSLWPLPAA